MRYFQQLQPFYSHAATSSAPLPTGQRSKITGLYLLLLLSQGDYAGFHTLLESLEVVEQQHGEGGSGSGSGRGFEEDEFVQYPVRLEQWLMEGSYDRVWEETKSERVPSPEFAIFSNVSSASPLRPASTQEIKLIVKYHIDPHQHNPLRSRLLLRKSLCLNTSHKRQIPLIPRQRRRRH